jgi:23S rRNA (uracil1939-C5)-methyltransferase
VLVSCDPAAFARDVSLLRDGGYELQAITPVDLFPHTPHVECVSVLDYTP